MATRTEFVLTPATAVRPSPCPTCGRKLNSARGLTDKRTPTAGDMTICTRCGGVAKFVASAVHGVVLRALSDEERALVDADPRLSLVRHAIRTREAAQQPAVRPHRYRGRA